MLPEIYYQFKIKTTYEKLIYKIYTNHCMLLFNMEL